jgi:hypothetical protein
LDDHNSAREHPRAGKQSFNRSLQELIRAGACRSEG